VKKKVTGKWTGKKHSIQRLLAYTGHRLHPLACSKPELSSETMNPFKTFWYNSTERGSGNCKASTYTGQHITRKNVGTHPCLGWDSNPQSQCLSRSLLYRP